MTVGSTTVLIPSLRVFVEERLNVIHDILHRFGIKVDGRKGPLVPLGFLFSNKSVIGCRQCPQHRTVMFPVESGPRVKKSL